MKKILIALTLILTFLIQDGLADSNNIRFSPKNGGFSVEFQSTPKEFDVPNSPQIEARTYQFSNSDLSYSQTVHYRDLSKDFLSKNTSEEILNQMRDAGIATNNAKIARELNMYISNRLAKDVFYIRNDGGQTRARYVINNGRFYAVIVTATKEDVINTKRNLQNDQASNKFFLSFKLENLR